ncbi:MAG TPA: hypothetical protein VIF37_16840 [Methylobacter sp.]|jgi:hypothetical protein
METYLPVIKALLSEWYLFTLNNPLYAAALATAVWLLTATLYSIRIASLKRKKAASEKAGFESLNAMQQQLQQSQEALAETVQQMEKAQHAAQDETQRALALEQLIYQRNQQIAGTIQTLATSFDLGERPLLASEDVKADSLWQQHDKVILQLIERLRTEQQAKVELQQTCQAETAKLAEKEALLEVLQTTLAAHTNQLSKLEQTLEEQKAKLQQQDNAQQALSETLKNFQPVAVQRAEPVVLQRIEPEPVQPVKPSETWQPPIQPENPAIEETLITQPVPEQQVEQINPEPPQAPAPAEQEPQIELAATEETITPGLLDIYPQLVEEEAEAPAAPSDQEQQSTTPAKGSLGKIKNLFGKKQQPVKTEPQWTDETLPSNTDQQPDDIKAPGKLKGFYSKLRPKK